MLDIKISGGTVIDGTGAPGFAADIGILGEHIAAVGDSLPSAARTLDASGKVVCPGFVDTHSHSDLKILGGSLSAKIRQGITTELLGQDGLGVAPAPPAIREDLAQLTAGLLGPHPADGWNWSTFGEYLTALDLAKLPSNAAVLVSHGPVRLCTVGSEDRPPEPEELARMQELVALAMESGARGFSTGLIYPPASYAQKDELIALNRPVAAQDGVCVVHLRDEGHYLLEALEEMIDVAAETGVRLHISHLQAYGRVNWSLLPAALQRIDAARRDGIEITCDRYPYTAGSTVLSAVLPGWVLDGGPGACLGRLRDPGARSEIHAAFQEGLDVWHNRAISVGWQNIVVAWTAGEDNRDLQGQSIEEIADSRGVDPVDAVCDLLVEEDLQVSMISHYGSEENLESILKHPACAVATDGIYGGKPHPRLWGTYPRVLGKYVRERGVLSMPEAVHKATLLPCRIMGIPDRGTVAEGRKADLVVFDPESVRDRATYEKPERSPAGLKAVMVNGRFAWGARDHELPVTREAGVVLRG